MPYIKPEQRTPELDNVIDNLASNIAGLPSDTDEGFVGVAGKLNYSISRLCAQIMDKPSYVKIALITGVLENVKQEFYRSHGICNPLTKETTKELKAEYSVSYDENGIEIPSNSWYYNE